MGATMPYFRDLTFWTPCIFFVDEPCRPELNHRINSTNEDDHDRFNSIEEEVSKDKTNFNFKNSFFHDEFKVSEI